MEGSTSEERQKKRQERVGIATEESPKSKIADLWRIVLILAAMRTEAGALLRKSQLRSFAKCLASNQAKMYGALLVSALRRAKTNVR